MLCVGDLADPQQCLAPEPGRVIVFGSRQLSLGETKPGSDVPGQVSAGTTES